MVVKIANQSYSWIMLLHFSGSFLLMERFIIASGLKCNPDFGNAYQSDSFTFILCLSLNINSQLSDISWVDSDWSMCKFLDTVIGEHFLHTPLANDTASKHCFSLVPCRMLIVLRYYFVDLHAHQSLPTNL